MPADELRFAAYSPGRTPRRCGQPSRPGGQALEQRARPGAAGVLGGICGRAHFEPVAVHAPKPSGLSYRRSLVVGRAGAEGVAHDATSMLQPPQVRRRAPASRLRRSARSVSMNSPLSAMMVGDGTGTRTAVAILDHQTAAAVPARVEMHGRSGSIKPSPPCRVQRRSSTTKSSAVALCVRHLT